MTPFLRFSDGGSQEKVRVLGPSTEISKLSGGPSGAVENNTQTQLHACAHTLV